MIGANNVNTFKNRLDRLWSYHELIYDGKSTLTGTGDRSFVDNVDDIIFGCRIAAG